MDIIKANITQEEPTQALGGVIIGQVFRFAFLSFTDALKEDAFYMVIQTPEKKGVSIVNLKDGGILIRDPDHRVIVHQTTISVIE